MPAESFLWMKYPAREILKKFEDQIIHTTSSHLMVILPHIYDLCTYNKTVDKLWISYGSLASVNSIVLEHYFIKN